MKYLKEFAIFEAEQQKKISGKNDSEQRKAALKMFEQERKKQSQKLRTLLKKYDCEAGNTIILVKSYGTNIKYKNKNIATIAVKTSAYEILDFELYEYKKGGSKKLACVKTFSDILKELESFLIGFFQKN